jgi:hypothetical protein
MSLKFKKKSGVWSAIEGENQYKIEKVDSGFVLKVKNPAMNPSWVTSSVWDSMEQAKALAEELHESVVNLRETDAQALARRREFLDKMYTPEGKRFIKVYLAFLMLTPDQKEEFRQKNVMLYTQCEELAAAGFDPRRMIYKEPSRVSAPQEKPEEAACQQN